jgi:peptidoglycan hydrolase-like protein with peptidoglycan-binding domain
VVYLLDNPPARRQFRAPRRENPIGVIGVHTAENPADVTGTDSGAENVARFIAGRSDPGSYHDLVDADSRIQLVPYTAEAFHIATHGLNRRTTGLAFACRTVDWSRMDPARRSAFVRNGAAAAVEQARYHHAAGRVIVPARRITLAQALAGAPGFLAHADADPVRRSDPGSAFPWNEFLTAFAELAHPVFFPPATPPPAPPAARPPATQPTETEAIVQSLPVLRIGDRGDDVARVQGLMVAVRHRIVVDGSFGPDTEAQVMSYQRARRLKVDGIVGPQTWRSLLGVA